MQQRRSEGLWANLWELPGGKIERWETPEKALERELREELGVEAKAGKRLLTVRHAYTRYRVRLQVLEAAIVAAGPGRWPPGGCCGPDRKSSGNCPFRPQTRGSWRFSSEKRGNKKNGRRGLFSGAVEENNYAVRLRLQTPASGRLRFQEGALADGHAPPLFRADADAFAQIEHENLAVAHFSGLGALDDGADRGSTKFSLTAISRRILRSRLPVSLTPR